MKKIILGLAIISGFVSCNKNQAVVKNLEGEWEIKSWRVDGDLQDITNGTMEFETCKLKEDDCDGNWTYTYEDAFGDNETASIDFTYAISESGNEMFMTFDYGDNDFGTIEAEIVLEDEELEIEARTGDVTVVFELEKDN